MFVSSPSPRRISLKWHTFLFQNTTLPSRQPAMLLTQVRASLQGGRLNDSFVECHWSMCCCFGPDVRRTRMEWRNIIGVHRWAPPDFRSVSQSAEAKKCRVSIILEFYTSVAKYKHYLDMLQVTTYLYIVSNSTLWVPSTEYFLVEKDCHYKVNYFLVLASI